MTPPSITDPPLRRGRRIKQFGTAAVCFFLLKGILWLALGFGAIEGCSALVE